MSFLILTLYVLFSADTACNKGSEAGILKSRTEVARGDQDNEEL